MIVYILPETNKSHLKMDGWLEDEFPFGRAYFQGLQIRFREGVSPFNPSTLQP